MSSTVPKSRSVAKTKVPTNGHAEPKLRRASTKKAPADLSSTALEARLAILDEVGEALSQQLDLNAIAELVGQRLHETFPDVGLFVALYDGTSNIISFPYEVDIATGERYHTAPMPVAAGLTGKVIRTRKPLLILSNEQALAEDAIQGGTSLTESWLGVPMVVGDDVVGMIGLESGRVNDFDQSDVRLVATLASSTAVALHNAKLFAETTQRNAELAVINEIGDALAKQLDFQGIIDAVGDRVLEILNTNDLTIAILDPQTEPSRSRFTWTTERAGRAASRSSWAKA